MERIIIIDDHLCKAELAEFLEANKDHIKLNSTIENLKSTTRIFFNELVEGVGEKNKLVIDSEEKINFVRAKDIVRIEFQEGKSKIFLKKGKPLETKQDIDSIEKKLPANYFLRIHDIHLVNLDFLLSCRFVNEPCVHLTNGEVLPISEKRKDQIIRQLEKNIKNFE
jgi:two-component system LytT family response regulator